MKIIIWGHPLYSHTMSYIFYGFEKAAKYLGHEVYWIDHKAFPTDNGTFYKDAIFITEGSVDKDIPIRSDCTYIVHSIHPEDAKRKYLGKVKRFIDLRYNHTNHKDEVYEFHIDKSKLQKIGPCCYLEKNSEYDRVYMSWATDLLPHEFDYMKVFKQREDPPSIYFLGTISNQGRCENASKINPLVESCNKAGIRFVHNDPWLRPLTAEQVRYFTEKSIIAPDIRGPELLWNGYVPCRIFKNISYGHLGITNSPEVYSELEGHCILTDSSQMLSVGLQHKNDYGRIKEDMKFVREYHTYINRLEALLSIL